MSHDPALEAHEHTEHAHHAAHDGDPFVGRVAITVAVLAVLAAVASSLEGIEGGLAITASSEAVLAQDKATDLWNEYEADSTKKHLYAIAAAQGGAHADDYARESKSQGAKQDDLKKRAQKSENEREKLVAESAEHERRHHGLTAGATLIEIGIALSTIAIITKRRTFWLAAMLLGAAGAAIAAAAFGALPS
ncbi:MAG: DUF4337 family protein [Alphaproteobacteria bacterium]|nr:DUF4337 family protein [Alphaproteobacteria bacterium]MBV9694721.1 DUF4337 family protein [Alphaproteobacteria bacterium]